MTTPFPLCYTPELWTAIGTWIVALVTAVLAAGTIYLVKSQIAEQKKATGLQLFVQLTHDFQVDDMRRLRTQFARALLAHRGSSQVDSDPLSDETVVEFFENLAHLTKSGILDLQMVWNYFSIAVECYWLAVRDLIGEMRRTEDEDLDLYRDWQWLAEEFLRLDGCRRSLSVPYEPSKQRVEGYLQSEVKLNLRPNAVYSMAR